MITQLVHKLKSALRNEDCSYCQFNAVTDGLICDECRPSLGLRDGFPLVRRGDFMVHSAALFNPKIKRLLYPYKFYHRTDYATSLADILTDYWNRVDRDGIDPQHTVVVPIPSRWRENHVSAFAREFAHAFGYRFDDGLLSWERDTMPQHKLTGKKRRWDNVKGSMAVDAEQYQAQDLKRKGQGPKMVPTRTTIVILDDMTTTGATFYEASQAFKRLPGFEGTVINLSLCHVPLALHRQLS